MYIINKRNDTKPDIRYRIYDIRYTCLVGLAGVDSTADYRRQLPT